MKKAIEILIFVFAMTAFISCEKEEPIPDPEPFNYYAYISGSWEWWPYEEGNPEHYVFTFGPVGSTTSYSVKWYISGEERETTGTPIYSINHETGVLTMMEVKIYYYDYLGNPQFHVVKFPPCKMDVSMEEEMVLTFTEDPNNKYIFVKQ